MTSLELQVYGHRECSWCHRLLDLLKEKGILYEYYNVRDDVDARAYLMERQLVSVPQVFLDGVLIGGYDDVVKWLSKKH